MRATPPASVARPGSGDTINKSVKQLVTVGEEINKLNEKYREIIDTAKEQTMVEETGLGAIKVELAKLVERLKNI